MTNDRLARPILLLLLTVLVPSVGMVWMLREAVRNERMASNQRLREAYQSQLRSASQSVAVQWSERLRELTSGVDLNHAATAFEQIVSRGAVDGVLICDEAGVIVYPNSVSSVPLTKDHVDSRWLEAERHEFADLHFVEAATAYASIANDGLVAPMERAEARQSQLRCLINAGEIDAAVEVLNVFRREPNLTDRYGRSLLAASQLHVLEKLDRKSPAWNEIAAQLDLRLGDYESSLMSSTQRLFLMNELRRLSPGRFNWPTRDAEELSFRVGQVDNIAGASLGIHATPIADVFVRRTPGSPVIELYRTETIRDQLQLLTASIQLPPGVNFKVASPGERNDHLTDISLGDELDGWRLGVSMTGTDLVDATSSQRRAAHIWIATLVIAITCILAWMLTNAIRSRLRLAQLKNDLVATVSHELKTPLASIRLLVDTLINDKETSPKRDREYLQMISSENARLTRMIDHFLTFSRMEQTGNKLKLRPIDLNEVARQSVEVFREHHGEMGGRLSLHLNQSTPVLGDTDALVTVVVNLLENAWKCSDDPKPIELITNIQRGRGELAVRDHGIGMSSRSIARIFDRFYQVDQSVARTRDGCGLGLSIVHSIVNAHGGQVRVESQLGVGSTFTLSLPKATFSTTESVIPIASEIAT